MHYHHDYCGDPSGEQEVEHGHEGLPGLRVDDGPVAIAVAFLPDSGHGVLVMMAASNSNLRGLHLIMFTDWRFLVKIELSN